MLTAAQLAANRRNAQRSTGPKTPEGKARSRGNALKHGLTSTTVLPPDEEAEFHDRLEDWNDSLQPENPVEAFLVRTAVLASVKLDRCARADFAHVAAARRTTVAAWDEEQQARLLPILDSAPEDPGRAIAQLEEFATGCDWLIDAWSRLAEALDATDTWTADQLAEAHHLLGLDADMAANPDPRIAIVHAYLTGPDRRLFVQAELDRLAALREQVWETHDAPALAERINIAVIDTSPAGSLRHRYQLAAFQQFFRSLKSFEARHPARAEAEAEGDEPAALPRALARLVPTRPQPAPPQAAPAVRNEPRPAQPAEPSVASATARAGVRNKPTRDSVAKADSRPLPGIGGIPNDSELTSRRPEPLHEPV